LEKLGETGLLLGVRPNEQYSESDFSFEIGDRLLLYTDGLLEAENTAGQSFGDAALPTFIQKQEGLGAEQFLDLLLSEVLAWSRNGTEPRQEDDITMLVIDIHGGPTLNP
jgi:sigma-B regulation protein RsbU (phosphoserine phosphatase)